MDTEGVHYLIQAGLELLYSCDPPILPSLEAWSTGVYALLFPKDFKLIHGLFVLNHILSPLVLLGLSSILLTGLYSYTIATPVFLVPSADLYSVLLFFRPC